MSDWLRFDSAIPVLVAEPVLPDSPGKYAFFVEDLAHLPETFARDAHSRPDPRLIYIGKADVSLKQRVWWEECQHRRPGTFFRSVGAMLGFKSPSGGRNYEFKPGDKQLVIEWIARNLRVAWKEGQFPSSHFDSEQALIRNFTPLLNLQGNPRKFEELSKLRAICRAGQAA
ncbi:MAG: GIY-YIG nuclease family protein [Croceibacterium sp.]